MAWHRRLVLPQLTLASTTDPTLRRVLALFRADGYQAAAYDATLEHGWEAAAAVTTIFLEGTNYERGEIDASAPRRPVARLSQHPLVKHYGLDVKHLALTKAHRAVEGDHRKAAWHVMLDCVQPHARRCVVARMQETLAAWQGYRNEVAEACGIERGTDGQPVRLAS